MNAVKRLLLDRGAASAVEFALVLPVLLWFLLGIIDVGRLMYVWNKAEKATQMGVRFAAVTDFVPATLNTAIFTDPPYNLVGGDPVPTSTFSSTICDTTSCTGNWGYNATAYNNIVERMRLMFPGIGGEANNKVTIQYENVGLGYAGDPSGPDVSALVTVRLQNITFRPFVLLGTRVTLPPFSAALTMEDGAGTVSN